MRSDLVLVVITLIWGTTFSITKLGLRTVPPLLFLAIRFLLAFGLLLGVSLRRPVRVTRRDVTIGAFVGLIYGAGFITQTMGIRLTTASKAAFITGLSVILVPLLSSVILRRRPTSMAILGSVLAFIGLSVLSVDRSLTVLLSFGDLLVLLCTVFFALHILFVGKWAASIDPVIFTTVQVGTTGALCAFSSLLTEEFPSPIGAPVWGGLFYLALFATLGTTLMQVWAQRYTTPTRTAVIFTLEPVFAAVFAYFLLAEAPSWKTLLGGALIVAGILAAEVPGFRGHAQGDSAGGNDCPETFAISQK